MGGEEGRTIKVGIVQQLYWKDRFQSIPKSSLGKPELSGNPIAV